MPVLFPGRLPGLIFDRFPGLSILHRILVSGRCSPGTSSQHAIPTRLPDSPVRLLNKNQLASPSAKPVSLTGRPAGTSALTGHRRGIPCPEDVALAGRDFEFFVFFGGLDDWKQGARPDRRARRAPGASERPESPRDCSKPLARRHREASFHKRATDRAGRTGRSAGLAGLAEPSGPGRTGAPGRSAPPRLTSDRASQDRSGQGDRTFVHKASSTCLRIVSAPGHCPHPPRVFLLPRLSHGSIVQKDSLPMKGV